MKMWAFFMPMRGDKEMGLFVVEAIKEIDGNWYALALDDDGEMYIEIIDQEMAEAGACEIGEVLLDAAPIHIADCESAVRTAFER